MKELILEKGRNARNASRELAKLNTAVKNLALKYIAEELEQNRQLIKSENEKDLENGRIKELSQAFLDRLALNDARIDGMIKVLNDVISLKDPVGEIFNMNSLPNGLKVGQMRVPIGVIGIVFESRPNVCIEVAALTIKSGNSVILRGGSDAIHSNICITSLIKKAMKKAGLPEGAVEVIENTERESVLHLVRMREYVDIIIPRGGLQLIRFVEENSLVPVVRHDLGICHTYVDEFASIPMAVDICYNAKVQRPGVCNAMETMLVHKAIAGKFLPEMKKEFDKAGVELRGCNKTRAFLPEIKDAADEDWGTEYLALILSVKVVESAEEAIDHINTYSSNHSDAIVTDSYSTGMKFITEVDSAACFINASTRFSDGNEFGLGAEMGISNQKLHVRGPMGLKDLTAPKYIVLGNGQIRA
ncbi:MAG: glutamate-5-semialdehyde dehydrogenase [Bacteroidales bacterium]